MTRLPIQSLLMRNSLQEHKFVVTAKDGAPDPRLATATVTVLVQDVEDEVPVFSILEYKSRVPENVPGYMIIRVKVSRRRLN